MMLSRALYSLTIGVLLLASAACGSHALDDSSNTSGFAGENAGAAYQLTQPGYQLARPAYQYYSASISIRYDQDYLDALKTRAEAALIYARAEARRSNAEADVIRQAAAEIAKELHRLDGVMRGFERERALIEGLGRSLEKLTKGETTKEVLEATTRFASIAELPLEDWLEIDVPPLLVDDFISRGAFIVRDGRIGQNQVEPFAGGNLISYIEFLSERRQDVRLGSKAHAPLISIYDQIKSAGRERLAKLTSLSEDIARQQRATWTPLVKLIEVIESRRAPSHDDQSQSADGTQLGLVDSMRLVSRDQIVSYRE